MPLNPSKFPLTPGTPTILVRNGQKYIANPRPLVLPQIEHYWRSWKVGIAQRCSERSKRSLWYNKRKLFNPATTVFFVYTEDGWGRFLPHVEYKYTAMFNVKINISGWSVFYLSISEKDGNSPRGLLPWRHDVTMTLVDVNGWSYMKSDVFCGISSCRLHTKPYKLVFLKWFVLANQAEWISISSVHYFQDGGQAFLTYLLLLTYMAAKP